MLLINQAKAVYLAVLTGLNILGGLMIKSNDEPLDSIKEIPLFLVRFLTSTMNETESNKVNVRA